MRIGIMTMQRVPNYGSFLQAYSLKKMIESLGHEVVFVDYRVDPDIEHKNDIQERVRCFVRRAEKDLIATPFGHLAKRILRGNRQTPRSVMFSCDGRLGITDKRRYSVKCDVLVIGSDEVFNCLQLGPNIGYSLELFGKNSNAKRVVSYAASCGNTTIDKLRSYGVDSEVGRCLERFYDISVRDSNTAEVVKELTGRDATMHLDPVLVAGVELEKWAPCNKSDYMILYGYSYRFSEEECRHVIDFAHARGLKLIAVGEDQLLRDDHVRCKPDEVIPLFYGADYVVTDTFHGTIFSIITHTPFLTIPRDDKKGQGGNIQKIISLLDTLGLSERLVTKLDTLNDEMMQDIDFSAADAIRSNQANRSLEYLKNCFSGLGA